MFFSYIYITSVCTVFVLLILFQAQNKYNILLLFEIAALMNLLQ